MRSGRNTPAGRSLTIWHPAITRLLYGSAVEVVGLYLHHHSEGNELFRRR